MEVRQVFKPFDIQEVSLSVWEDRPVKNNFFELVLIKEGRGTQCINYNLYEYSRGSLFLLPPLKCHSFQIVEPTRFVFLKFTSDFFQDRELHDQQEWFREAAYILSNYNQLPGDIISEPLDRQHLHTLIDMILQENKNFRQGSISLIRSLMTSILEILMRNIKASSYYTPDQQEDPDERITQIVSYINQHISEPHLLKVDQLAQTFLLAPTYFSEYFRKKMNVSLRDYIIKSRLKQVEIRLLNSDFTLTEIAEELGFTDVSHLSRTFKKYTGMTMRQFRKEGEYQLLKRNVCVA